jgi:hypothetical protein
MEHPLLWFSKAVDDGYAEEFPGFLYTNRCMLPDA